MSCIRALGFSILMLVSSLTPCAIAGDGAVQSEAEQHVKAGIAYRDDPSGLKLEDAYREFRAAYALVPSHLILMNIGYCAMHLERDAEAIEAYTRFLDEAPSSALTAEERKQMKSDVDRLRAGLVTVSLRTIPENITIVDERVSMRGPSVVNRYSIAGERREIGIHPGRHRLTAMAEGYTSQSWEFEAPPASKHAQEFKLVRVAASPTPVGGEVRLKPTTRLAGGPPLPKAGSDRSPTSETVYLGAAITGIFLVGTAVTGTLALSKAGQFKDLNSDGMHREQAQAARDEARRYALWSDIGLGATAISAGVTTYLYLTRGIESQRDEAPRTSMCLTPRFARSHAELSLSGTF